jgi:hypothetical protein
MGDRHHDPSDHFRTTQPHAGITMKDNLFWPGFILLVVALGGMIGTAVVAAYGHSEWLATTVLVAVLGTVAGALWFVVYPASTSSGTSQTPTVRRASAPPANGQLVI